MRTTAAAAVLLLTVAASTFAQSAITYRLSFPEPEHRWMQVELTLADLPAAPLELHMSRASPGRYALHEFAKNVFDVRVTDAAGAAVHVTHMTPHQWVAAEHPSAVRVSHRLFCDRTDATDLSGDP